MEACYIADLKRFKNIVYGDADLASNYPVFYNMAESESGRTCIMLCGNDPQDPVDVLDKNCLEMLKILEEKGKEIQQENLSLTKSEKNINNGEIEKINDDELIGINYKYVDDYNWDLLYFAISKNFTSLSSYLIDKKFFTPNLRSKDTNLTHLILAGNYGNEIILKKLIQETNGKLLEKDKNLYTFLHYLINYCRVYNNKYLLKEIININKIQRKLNKFLDEKLNNLLYFIIFYNNFSYQFYLNSITSSSSLNKISKRKKFDKELIEILLDAGINPLHKNIDGKKISELIQINDDDDLDIKNLILEYEAKEIEKQHQYWLDHQDLEF